MHSTRYEQFLGFCSMHPLARAWLSNRAGQAIARSNVTQRRALAVKTAALTTPRLAGRTISPHCLRHTTAMHLQSGVDISAIAVRENHDVRSHVTSLPFNQRAQTFFRFNENSQLACGVSRQR
jgi:integrase